MVREWAKGPWECKLGSGENSDEGEMGYSRVDDYRKVVENEKNKNLHCIPLQSFESLAQIFATMLYLQFCSKDWLKLVIIVQSFGLLCYFGFRLLSIRQVRNSKPQPKLILKFFKGI